MVHSPFNELRTKEKNKKKSHVNAYETRLTAYGRRLASLETQCSQYEETNRVAIRSVLSRALQMEYSAMLSMHAAELADRNQWRSTVRYSLWQNSTFGFQNQFHEINGWVPCPGVLRIQNNTSKTTWQ